DLVLDAGRLNQAHHGMAQSGPLDARAARLANALAGNPAGTPLIESTLNGPRFTTLRDVVVGAAGRGFTPAVDEEPAAQRTSLLRSGQTIHLRASGFGVRGYLALAGGIETGEFLGSASVDRYGLIGRPLKAGDVLGLAREDAQPHEMQARA